MPAPHNQAPQLDAAGKRRLLVLGGLYPALAASAFALALALLYPNLFPAQAQRADDPIGYWIGTLGIPAVAILVMARGIRRFRAEQETHPPEL